MGPADIVISLAGHDRGEAFVVLEANEQSVLVADGKNRKLSRPKRKNTKHINSSKKTRFKSSLSLGV